ncbi:hypothetical protein SynBIOSE41_02827 [Synechococcus sp. BIOS-E4-1]|nr:hypothetical protein SynBIOSE41_02827 [Synechococcus sp. BIOS-E4-1]
MVDSMHEFNPQNECYSKSLLSSDQGFDFVLFAISLQRSDV